MPKWSKKQGIQHATRKSTRSGDANKLDDIQQHLQQQGLVVNREVKHPEFYGRETDIRVIFPKGNADLQLDGFSVHGTLESEQNKKTRRRNVHLTKLNLEWRIVDEALCKALGIRVVDMATYLVYEANMHLVARSEI